MFSVLNGVIYGGPLSPLVNSIRFPRGVSRGPLGVGRWDTFRKSSLSVHSALVGSLKFHVFVQGKGGNSESDTLSGLPIKCFSPEKDSRLHLDVTVSCKRGLKPLVDVQFHNCHFSSGDQLLRELKEDSDEWKVFHVSLRTALIFAGQPLWDELSCLGKIRRKVELSPVVEKSQLQFVKVCFVEEGSLNSLEFR
ncbi:MAG: hypothetical protein VW378_03310 [bacterium]